MRFWTPFSYANLLMRVRDTHQQVGRMRADRLENMQGAFQATNYKSQIPVPVLLVDDVWTTGATLSECAKTLKQAGVKKVWGLSVSRIKFF